MNIVIIIINFTLTTIILASDKTIKVSRKQAKAAQITDRWLKQADPKGLNVEVLTSPKGSIKSSRLASMKRG